jgi:hypothetical protein
MKNGDSPYVMSEIFIEYFHRVLIPNVESNRLMPEQTSHTIMWQLHMPLLW